MPWGPLMSNASPRLHCTRMQTRSALSKMRDSPFATGPRAQVCPGWARAQPRAGVVLLISRCVWAVTNCGVFLLYRCVSLSSSLCKNDNEYLADKYARNLSYYNRVIPLEELIKSDSNLKVREAARNALLNF